MKIFPVDVSAAVKSSPTAICTGLDAAHAGVGTASGVAECQSPLVEGPFGPNSP
jgi:hypothetical protein